VIARVLLPLLFAMTSIAGAFDLPKELANVADPTERVGEIDAAIRAEFDAALREYDTSLAAHPEDVSSIVQKCRFIDEFAGTYEYASFVDELYEDSDACYEQLAQDNPEHPEIVLVRLARIYGKEMLDDGVEVLANTARQSWTSGQLARLYAMLATTAQTLEDKRALEFARTALRFDEAADVRIIVAEHLTRLGDKDELIDVLTSPADGHDVSDTWYAVRKMQLLAEAGARDAVIEIYAAIKEDANLDAVAAASALRRAGAIDAARDAFARIDAESVNTPRVAAERFRFELEFGTPALALAAYDAWRDGGWSEDPLGINRVALLVEAPFLPLRARDLLGLVGFFGALLAVAVACVIPIVLVHYRGLVRRARTGELYPSGGWHLTHAWAALFAFFATSLVAAYCAGPLSLSLDTVALWGVDATPAQLARITLIGELLLFAALLPVGMSAMRAQPRWWGARWPVLKSMWVAASIALLLRAPVLLGTLMTSGDVDPGTTQQDLWRVLEYISDNYSTMAALWLVVFAAPVVEELIFRGALLRAFAAHVSFGWANALQALLFAGIHFEPRALPVLFAVGYIAGHLARRSNGLLAPMLLHFFFNLIAALIFMF
jgi:membrane protease YdiL (CAAX protease family)